MARLFDPGRDPEARVEPGEWFAPSDAPEAFRRLYAHETVGQRRRWYTNLMFEGRLPGRLP